MTDRERELTRILGAVVRIDNHTKTCGACMEAQVAISELKRAKEWEQLMVRAKKILSVSDPN